MKGHKINDMLPVMTTSDLSAYMHGNDLLVTDGRRIIQKYKIRSNYC